MSFAARYVDREPVGDWATQAACAGMDPDLFFPHVGTIPREARRVCASCPVREECLEHALDNCETHGVWAGTSDAQRQRIGYRRSVKLLNRVAVCGSDSGYKRHRRAGEMACDECKAAHSCAETNRRVTA